MARHYRARLDIPGAPPGQGTPSPFIAALIAAILASTSASHSWNSRSTSFRALQSKQEPNSLRLYKNISLHSPTLR